MIAVTGPAQTIVRFDVRRVDATTEEDLTRHQAQDDQASAQTAAGRRALLKKVG